MTPAVHTEGLTRRFGRRVALDDISLDIATGEVFGLIGPNGAGKTTMIRILCAILRPSSGSAHVLGFELGKEGSKIRPHVGYMSQGFSLYPTLTVAENLRFYRDIYGHVSAARQDDVSRLVGLGASELSTPVAELATGTRQRAALAAAILHQPRLLFLDEPTSGVDPVGRRDIWSLIRELARSGTTIIVTTHVMAEAERCDRVALMADGHLLTCGIPTELRTRTNLVVAVVDADPWQAAYAELERRWPGTTLRGTTIRVLIPADADVAAEITAAISDAEITHLEWTQPSFEDAFIWFIRRLG